MRAHFINEEEWFNNFENVVDSIFGIWDRWNDDGRQGIQKKMIGLPGEGIFHIEFEFPYGFSDDFVVDVDEYLKIYKIKHFGEIDPFEWEWKHEDFQSDALIIKPIQ